MEANGANIVRGENAQEPEAKRQRIEQENDIIPEYQQIILDDIRTESFWQWLNKYRSLSIHDLYKLFDQTPTDHLTIEELLPLLKDKFDLKSQKRQRIESLSTVSDAVNLINRSNNILIITGAGVSVSCGIPDFRSKNGIYSRLSEFELSDPQEMFDIRERPETFYSFANEIYPANFTPSSSHMFIKMLQDKGKLLRLALLIRNYTQNIDTLETKSGITNLVQCHGSFATCSCINCHAKFPGTFIEPQIYSKQVPSCPNCKDGVIKPDIVFFGESLPREFHDLIKRDLEKVDLLIVMGSSLKVAPVANVMHRVRDDVPQILINMESLKHMERFDIHLLGYSDTITRYLAKELGWGDLHTTSVAFAKPTTVSLQPAKSQNRNTNSVFVSETSNTNRASFSPTRPDIGFIIEPFQQGHLPWVWYFEGAIQNSKDYSNESSDEESESEEILRGDYEPPESGEDDSGTDDSGSEVGSDPSRICNDENLDDHVESVPSTDCPEKGSTDDALEEDGYAFETGGNHEEAGKSFNSRDDR